MQTEQIYAELTPIFRELFDDDTLVPVPSMTAADVPEWDSFNHINLIVTIETRFGIKFQTAELESLTTVGHLAGLIQSKLALQGR